ncbi:unnamed protein product [Bursaphelenchus xylophilus]|uniref:(pine wood nematode) hypothetical protein n=1 Tax=Bursaphelenchus xylophilus TaxID=6326 RepID=A0A1I7SC66_BURXY|nr:unnamed protein product [Bursaphelenchus xylophilus]CAG9094660.1 unnamed protein product [Bursaphelenchus xylophilus]
MDSSIREQSSISEEDNSFLEAFKAIAAKKAEEHREKTGQTITFEAEAIKRVAQSAVWTVENRWKGDLKAYTKHAKRVRSNADDGRLIFRRDPKIASRVDQLFHALARHGVVKPQKGVAPTTPKPQTSMADRIKEFKAKQPQADTSMSELPKHLRVTMETMDDSEFDELRRNLLKKLGEEEKAKNLPVIKKLAIGSPELERLRKMTEISSDFDASKTNSFEEQIERGVARMRYHEKKKLERENRKKQQQNVINVEVEPQPGPSGVTQRKNPQRNGRSEEAQHQDVVHEEADRIVDEASDLPDVPMANDNSSRMEANVNKTTSRNENLETSEDVIHEEKPDKEEVENEVPVGHRIYPNIASLIEAFQNPKGKNKKPETPKEKSNLEDPEGPGYGEFGLDSTNNLTENRQVQEVSTRRGSRTTNSTTFDQSKKSGNSSNSHAKDSRQKSVVPEETNLLTFSEMMSKTTMRDSRSRTDPNLDDQDHNDQEEEVLHQETRSKDSLDDDLGLDLNFGQEAGGNVVDGDGKDGSKEVEDSFYKDDFVFDLMEGNNQKKIEEQALKEKNLGRIDKTSESNAKTNGNPAPPLDTYVTQRTLRTRQTKANVPSERPVKQTKQSNGVFYVAKSGGSANSRASSSSREKVKDMGNNMEANKGPGLATISQDSLFGDLQAMDNVVEKERNTPDSVEIIDVIKKGDQKSTKGTKMDNIPEVVDITHDEDQPKKGKFDLRYCKRKSTTPRTPIPAKRPPMRIKDQRELLKNPLKRKDTLKKWIEIRKERRRLRTERMNKELAKKKVAVPGQMKDNVEEPEKNPESNDSFYNDDIVIPEVLANRPVDNLRKENCTVQSKIKRPEARIAGQSVTAASGGPSGSLEGLDVKEKDVGHQENAPSTSSTRTTRSRPNQIPIVLVNRPKRPQIVLPAKGNTSKDGNGQKTAGLDENITHEEQMSRNQKMPHGEGRAAQNSVKCPQNGNSATRMTLASEAGQKMASNDHQVQHEEDEDSLNGDLNLDNFGVPNSLDVPLFLEEGVKETENVQKPQKPKIIIQPRKSVNTPRAEPSVEIIDHQRPRQPAQQQVPKTPQIQSVRPIQQPGQPTGQPTGPSRFADPPTPAWFNPRGMSTPIAPPTKRPPPPKPVIEIKRKRT